MTRPGLTRRELLTAAAACGLQARVAQAAGSAVPAAALAQRVDALPVAGALLCSPRADGAIADATLLHTLADLARAQGALLHSPVPVGTRIVYSGQPLGIVLAPEQATAQRAAQALFGVLDHALAQSSQRPRLSMAVAVQHARSPAQAREFDRTDGHAEAAFDRADYRLKQTYSLAAELPAYGAPLWVEAQAQRPLPLIVLSHPPQPELADRLARWSKLPVDWITLQIASPDGEPALFDVLAKLAWSASSKLRRPVKLVLTHEQARVLGGQRPELIQILTLGAERSGRIVAWVQQTLNASGMAEDVVEPCGLHMQRLYEPAERSLRHLLAPQSIGPIAASTTAGSVRGSFATEVALDELAALLDMDPLQLRIDNAKRTDTAAHTSPHATDPHAALQACRDVLNTRHGPASSPRLAGSQREGSQRVGSGVAVGAMPLFLAGSRERLGCVVHATRLRLPEGTSRIEILSQHVVLHCDGLAIDLEPRAIFRRVQRAVQTAWQSAFAQTHVYDPQTGALLPAGAPASSQPSALGFAGPDWLHVETIGLRAATDASLSGQKPHVMAQLEALATCGVAAALANALYQATGHRLRTLPLDLARLSRPSQPR